MVLAFAHVCDVVSDLADKTRPCLARVRRSWCEIMTAVKQEKYNVKYNRMAQINFPAIWHADYHIYVATTLAARAVNTT